MCSSDPAAVELPSHVPLYKIEDKLSSSFQVTAEKNKSSVSERELSAFRPTSNLETAGNVDLAFSDYTLVHSQVGQKIFSGMQYKFCGAETIQKFGKHCGIFKENCSILHHMWVFIFTNLYKPSYS